MKQFIVFLLYLSLAFNVAAQKDSLRRIEIINIENPAVQAYLADSTYYYETDYDTSIITKYRMEDYGVIKDHPQGKTVKWKPTTTADSISQILISLSENENFENSTVYEADSTNISSYTLINLYPRRTYYYKVEEVRIDSITTEMASGVFRTTGQVRMIKLDGVRNVRDIGGWMTSFGYPIKYGLLYRSANIDEISTNGIYEFAVNLGVAAELDLRGESPNRFSPLGKDVDYLVVSNDAYYKGLSEQNIKYFADFNWIVNRLREGKVVNWHCREGCDRCGTLSFLIEGLLGVSEVDLCRDYELSSFAGYPRSRSFSMDDKGSFADMLPYIKKFGPPNDLAQCFFNYWQKIGVSYSNLVFFRNTMLDTEYVPEEIEEEPGESGEEPGESGEEPGESGEEPGESGEEPGESGEEPGESGEEPGESGEEPGESGEEPGESGEEPGESGEEPGESGEEPGESGEEPGESGEEPGESGEEPGESGEEPGESGEEPGESGEEPGESGEEPGESGEDPGLITKVKNSTIDKERKEIRVYQIIGMPTNNKKGVTIIQYSDGSSQKEITK